MNYFTKNGIIGQFQGTDVYVISYKDFTEDMDNGNTLYAVKMPGQREYMTVVTDGKKIGYMSSIGHVEIYDKIKWTGFQYNKPSYVEPPKESEDIDFKKCSRVVDEFFDGLEKLWQEIERGFVE